MQDLIRNIKKSGIKQMFAALLVGCLLMVTTACSQGVDGVTTRETSQTYQGNARDTYDSYDANENYKGGMNGYDDDRRYDSGTTAKAKGLVDSAKNRQADSFEEVVDNLGNPEIDKKEKAAEKSLGRFADKLDRNKDKAAEYIDNKSDKLQRNIEKVPSGAKNVFEGAVDTAQDALEDATEATQKNAQRVKGNFEDLS